MNKLLVLIVGLGLIYLSASGRLQKVWQAVIQQGGADNA